MPTTDNWLCENFFVALDLIMKESDCLVKSDKICQKPDAKLENVGNVVKNANARLVHYLQIEVMKL